MKTSPGIYIITNTISKKIYIGQAVNLSNRWSGHKQALRRGNYCNTHLQRAWNKYGESAFEFKVLVYVENTSWLDHFEDKFIEEYKSYDRKIGYNVLKSGRGYTDESREKQRQTKLKDPLTRERMIYASSFRKNKKPIIQYDMQGNFIREWDSISDAANHYNKTTGEISLVCKDKENKNSAFGFLWRYKDDKREVKYKSSTKKEILQYKDGELIKEWKSLADVIRHFNTTYTSIWRVLKGHLNHYKGYKFYYK